MSRENERGAVPSPEPSPLSSPDPSEVSASGGVSAPASHSDGNGAGNLAGNLAGMALPQSAFVWLAVLVLSLLVSGIQNRLRPAPLDTAPALTATDFTAAVEARQTARLGLAQVALALQSRQEKDVAKARQDLKKPITVYRRLLDRAPSPITARRVLVLEHIAGLPLDSSLLNDALADALREEKATDSEIAKEIRLWRTLYDKPSGAATTTALNDVPAETERIREMNLGYLEDWALSDLYRVAGDTAKAEAAREEAYNDALTFAAQTLLLNLGAMVAFLIGIGALIVFAYALVRQNWRRMGFPPENTPDSTRPERIGYGSLADAFVAYLAVTELTRLLADYLIPGDTSALSGRVVVLFAAATYQLPALFGLGYLNYTLKRHGATWADIGWHAPVPFGRDLWYGVVAWCAALPLIISLGYLSRLIFQNDPNTAPNPVLPLVAGETDPLARLVIFLLAAVAAPLFEELFFRGVLLTGFRTRYSWGVAIALSAAVFAVVHPIQDWLPIFGLGLVLGTVRVVRGSLVPGIVVHTLQNGMTYFVLSAIFGT
ncbi:MAG: hypothetical protein OHK0029_06050 [Armatimonadaceae bacterium]